MASILPDPNAKAPPPTKPGVPVSALGNWTVQQTTLDAVNLEARFVSSNMAKVTKPKKPTLPKERYAPSSDTRKIEAPEFPEPTLGESILMLQCSAKSIVNSKNKVQPAPAALERTFLAVNSPPVRLPPGTLVRISGWVYIPGSIAASADGVLIYDSIGTESLGVRLTDNMPRWKQYHLYRRVPASGVVWVTLALTGIGTVYFDDVKIEPLIKGADDKAAPIAQGKK